MPALHPPGACSTPAGSPPSAALVQGMRDYFGAHTYRRIDDPGTFHTEWSDGRQEIRTSW
nr:hypothetical protein [Frankia sp. Cas4]